MLVSSTKSDGWPLSTTCTNARCASVCSGTVITSACASHSMSGSGCEGSTGGGLKGGDVILAGGASCGRLKGDGSGRALGVPPGEGAGDGSCSAAPTQKSAAEIAARMETRKPSFTKRSKILAP